MILIPTEDTQHKENIQQIEINFVGAIYNNPELLVDYGYYIRPQYDFADDATRFFFEQAQIMYQTTTQTFNKTNVSMFMTEEPERLKQYQKYGGWHTIEAWVKLSSGNEFDVRSAFDRLKKYSLLREYERKGFNTTFIRRHRHFDYMNARDIYKMIRTQADHINTVIMGDSDIDVLNSKVGDMIDNCLDTPDQGFEIPFPILNEVFMGMQKKTIMACAAMSNAGKSRLMIKLVAFATLVLKKRTLVLLNEMTVEKMRKALLTTVINNTEYKALHGVDITKPEREIVMGQYRDENGKFIMRKRDEHGNFCESTQDFLARVKKHSEEYRKVKQVADWIESQVQALIYVKDISADYSDHVLEFEIRKAVITKGVELWFYDTCKNEQVGEWSAFKATVTKLAEICKPLNVFGYISMQLNDETNNIAPESMNSSCIAEAKQTKHVLDSLVMIKQISKDEYHKYKYIKKNDEEWGSDVVSDLSPSKTYYCFVVDKNRSGTKPKVLFEVDLNLNIWTECGELLRR